MVPSPVRAEAVAPAAPTVSTSLAALDPRVRPLTMAAERSLPVLDALQGLLPAGLPRGATVAITGSAGRSFAVALVAAASQAGSWVALTGVSGFGWRAAGELGLDLARVVVIDPLPPEAAPAGLAALIDGFDAVLVGVGARVPPVSARRLAARARERGTVLVALVESWSSAGWTDRPSSGSGIGAAQDAFLPISDLRAEVEGEAWRGMGGGHGRLRGRQVTVRLEGRRLPGRKRQGQLWLPDPQGRILGVISGARAPEKAPGDPVLGQIA